MKIDKDKLVDLLVEKTEMGRDEVNNQLDQLIDRILDAAKRGKALEIKEFGVFYFDEEGELSFDPADELSTEISFKYAGMKPVELKPERDSSISETEEDTDEKATSEEAGEKSEKEKKEPAESDAKDVDDSLYDPFAPEAMEPLEEPVEEKPTTNMEDIKPVSRRPVKKQKDLTGVFILIAIIIIVVAIGGYFYYIGTQPQNLEEQIPSAVQTDPGIDETENIGDGSPAENEQADDSQELTGEMQTDVEQQITGQGSEEEIASDSGVSLSETDQPLYGLKGTVIEQANDGYSIVVHSFSSQDRAVTTADRLREDGYRVIITSRTVYEDSVWRVSVGQFETLADAQQATTQLPDPYNTQNFIQRIRIN